MKLHIPRWHIIVAFALIVACIGWVSADPGVNATPEVAGITTSTSIDCIGIVTESDSLAMTSTNTGAVNSPPLDAGQVQYTAGYNDNLMAVNGHTTFVKSMQISTANTIADQSNIKASTSLQFIGIDGGRATRDEDLMIDGAGQATGTAGSILCPFASSTSDTIPPFCNIVQAGSSIDTSLTSVVTNANARFIGTDATFPVVLNYNIAAKGITLSDGTSSPMIGSVSAYVKAHIQEARNASTAKSEDLVYSDTSSASGLINSFTKSISYQSGFNLI
ncbi:MAG TPA: hypothetical protein VMC42_02015 [Methanoregulaceae archaeon]|nr:hypothetical protein [Methanoregulaceae archaeon]